MSHGLGFSIQINFCKFVLSCPISTCRSGSLWVSVFWQVQWSRNHPSYYFFEIPIQVPLLAPLTSRISSLSSLSSFTYFKLVFNNPVRIPKLMCFSIFYSQSLMLLHSNFDHLWNPFYLIDSLHYFDCFHLIHVDFHYFNFNT
jgi:hypothetical protein